MKRKNIGSTFDRWLREGGLHEQVHRDCHPPSNALSAQYTDCFFARGRITSVTRPSFEILANSIGSLGPSDRHFVLILRLRGHQINEPHPSTAISISFSPYGPLRVARFEGAEQMGPNNFRHASLLNVAYGKPRCL
jgi:hypothetical protein